MADRNQIERGLAFYAKDLPLRVEDLGRAEEEYAAAQRRGEPQSVLFDLSESVRKHRETLERVTDARDRYRAELAELDRGIDYDGPGFSR